ncbi:MAG: fused MFS/spermidine synthase [Candidatus Nitrospinota bacterium M3_3B_026]
MSPGPAAVRPLLLFLFFFSGAVGVAYEVVWTRQLSLLLGVSVYAVSAVLVAFMGGLGVGAALFGRMIDRGASPVRLYAALEIALGAYVLAFPFTLVALEEAYTFLHPGYEGVSVYVILLRLTLAVLALAVPTTLMGGTLPALARFFVESGGGVGRGAGALYAVNTVGAMAGAVAAGFWMIEHLGLTGALRAGAAVNIAVGALAWLTAKEPGWKTAPSPETGGIKGKRRETAPDDPHTGMETLLLVLFGVSGFCALSLEVLWTRLLILLLNNSVYAFTLILAIFLLGIGLGSAVMARFTSRRLAGGGALFGLFQVLVGFFALLSLAGFYLNRQAPDPSGALADGAGGLAAIAPGGEPMVSAFVFALVVVFPATFVMGGGFPLMVEAAVSSRKRIGGDVGRLYAANIAGCVLGSLVAGFVLIPLLGIQKSVIAVAWLAILSGLFLLYVKSSRVMKAAFAAAVGIFLPMTAALAWAGDVARVLNVRKLEAGSRTEFYQEGPSATVLVSNRASDLTVGRKPIKRIWINGDPIAGVFREALQLERLQAHIPLLLRPGAKDALVICFGTGSTAGAALVHGLESVTAVDISREVFNAGPYFADGNFDVMNSPRLKVVEEDGRNFLLTTRRKFDFITSEPPPPSNAGVVSLYTVEYYELMKRRLRKGGLVSQWIPLHHLSERDFKMLVASFVEAFPHASMWYTKWDAIMIGSPGPVPLDMGLVRRGMKRPEVAQSLEEIGVQNEYQLAASYMMGRGALMDFVKGAAPLRDDRPVVEFSAPKVHTRGVEIKGRNLEALLEHRQPPPIGFPAEEAALFEKYFESERLYLKGQIARSDGDRRGAASYYGRALRINQDNSNARYAYLSLNLSILYSVLSKSDAALGLRMLEDTERMDRDGLFSPQLSFLKGVFLARVNRVLEARAELERAVRLDKDYFLALVNLAGLYATLLDEPEKAERLYRRAMRLQTSETEKKAIREAMRRLKTG